MGLSHLHTVLIDQFIFGQGFQLTMVFYYNVLDAFLEWMFFVLVQSLVIFYNALETFLEWVAFVLVQSLVIFYNILHLAVACITYPWRCCVALGHFLSSSIL